MKLKKQKTISKIYDFQYRLEKKISIFKDLSFDQWLYAVIGACGIQAIVQYLTVDRPESWQEDTELGLLSDPAFYLGLMLMSMMALLIIRKWKRIQF